jgi:hypothetical protein
MLLNKIESIRHQVADRELKLSDALLLVLRSLRERMPEERLTWLNRELLGYRQDDLEALSDQRMGLNMFLAWISESAGAPRPHRWLRSASCSTRAGIWDA